jgi:hypothetical protein
MQADDPSRLLPWDPAAAMLLALLSNLPLAGFRFEAQTHDQGPAIIVWSIIASVQIHSEADTPCPTADARLGLVAVLRIDRTSRPAQSDILSYAVIV